MKTHIHPDYRYLRREIINIINGDYVSVKIFRNKRNVVEKIILDGKEFVLKKYKPPTFFNRVVYTFFRKTKACRAFNNAITLLDNGVKTPFPVAYMEVYRKGLFHTGYFISEYLNYPVLSNLNFRELDRECADVLEKDFIDFTIKLQGKGILMKDYNPSNIFYVVKQDGHYDFALTDTNRIRFGKQCNEREIMFCFEQLGITAEYLYKFISAYSVKTKCDVEVSMFNLLFFRLRKRFRKFIKQRVKKRSN